MRPKKMFSLLLVIFPLFLGMMIIPSGWTISSQNDIDSDIVVLENGETIEVAPDEVLMKYVISDIPTSLSGTGYPLEVAEYGTRTDSFTSEQMVYYPSGTITTANLSVPMGEQWEGYYVYADVNSITENRSWVTNPNFNTDTTWLFQTGYEEGDFTGNNRIHYFTSTGTNIGTWGSRGTSTGSFIDPWGVAIDSSGNVYVADAFNNRVQVFTSTGTFIRAWGAYGTGNGQFDRPTGIAVNSSGYVYVVDQGNHRVQIFSSTGVYQGQFGSSGTGNGQFRSPVGIAIRDSLGYVYVTDMGNDRVQYFNWNGNRLGGWGSSGTANSQFRMPTGIAVDQSSGQVVVADSSNNRFQRFTATGTHSGTTGSLGGGNSNFRTPMGIAINSATGRIYVNDLGNHRISYFSSAGAYQGQWGSDGTGNNNLRFNYGIALDSTGNVYVSEGSGTGRMDANWLSNGHGTGNPSSIFEIDGYWHNEPSTALYGFWYNPGDKAFVRQDLVIDRGDVTWAGISLDYYANCRGWGNYMTGFFELFVSVGDPDHGGNYLWSKQFDDIDATRTWYSTGLIPVSYSSLSLPNLELLAGLRVTQSEWYRANDIRPEGRLDNIVVYIKAKATPENINLQMNGVDVQNVYSGSSPIFGLGTASYTPLVPWVNNNVYANFSWTPDQVPPDPNFAITVDIDADITAYARRYNSITVNNTELFTYGDNYLVQNNTDVNWETNHYVSIPGGYEDSFFYNITIPLNRDVTFVSEPSDRYTNLPSGWYLGDPGDGVVNISVYELGLLDPTGFWMVRGTSPNMISNVQVWDNSLSQWVNTKNFRADENTRFRALLSDTYENDVVTFTIYDSNGLVWDVLQATVDGSGYAITDYVVLDAVSARVGSWQVQALVNDEVSGLDVHNIGYFCRGFTITHATEMSVKYPVEGITSWSVNVTYGDIVFLQLRIEDTDNSELLPAGVLTYSGGFGSGSVNDMGTGEYSVTLDTGTLPSNGAYSVELSWSKPFYDSLFEIFTINVIYETNLLSSDAPGIDVASGNTAYLHLYFEDMFFDPIIGADINCNWTESYTITPDGFGNYLLGLVTTGMTLDVYKVQITASKDFYESRSIILSVEVRELHTSAIPSTSLLSLPVGYTTSFTITYRDTDLQVPISGAEGYISCNWSDIHSSGDQNYTVTETATPGVYEVIIYSMDDDPLGFYDILFSVERYGAQNQSFIVTVELRTHLTSLYLENSIESTPYTGNITVNLVYYDVDANTGIVNGTTLGGYVELIITTSGVPSLNYYVVSITSGGMYTIHIPADQWADVGTVILNIQMNWIGVNTKYQNLGLSASVSITAAPTDLFIGESPIVTPYGEEITFTVIYYDIGGLSGVVNGTGPYSGNVHLFIEVLTPGQTITQSDMIITEIDFTNNPGEYRITFDSSLLIGLGAVELKLWFNWTTAALPYYQNQMIVISVYTSNRLTVVDWTPLPVSPYDELVNLTFIFRDSLTGDPILDDPNLYISIPGYSFNVYYDGDLTGKFFVEIDTSAFPIGSNSFVLSVEWVGAPYYQNRTSVQIYITVRERYTSLTHGSYSDVQFGNTLYLTFTYRDLDDSTSIGMNGNNLTLDAWLTGYYTVYDNGDGTYVLQLDTSVFLTLGVFTVNVHIEYVGIRNCVDADDLFYLTLKQRRTQLTSDLPDLAPYLTQAIIVVHYTDDTTSVGIIGASINASCSTSVDQLQLGVNYWVDDNLDGSYTIRIDTVALGNFGSYSITITVSFSGSPYYQTRVRSVDIEVSRRPVTITVTKSPLNTPFLSNVTFEITVTDQLESSGITITKSNLILSHNGGTMITDGEYSITGSNGVYIISLNSLVLVSELEDAHPISIAFVWGDVSPYYGNASTSTQVSIVARFTQATVLQTPPGYYYFNMSALVRYSDYLTGSLISGATLTVSCLNQSSFDYWIVNNPDNTYTILIDTNSLPGLGRYFFSANFTWFGSPFYRNITGLAFSIIVNPVSTSLSFELPEGVTYYLGDTIYANITYIAIEFGTGVSAALVQTDWSLTAYSITEIAPGIYQMIINTSGLDAQLYRFNVNATKPNFLFQQIEVDILLSAIPVQIELEFLPTNPVWGDTVEFQANVTDARLGTPILGANVTLTLDIVSILLTDDNNDGIYNCTILTSWLDAGEYTIRVESILVNYETRQRDFQIRIDKVPARLVASIDPQSAVNGQTITVEVSYLIYSNSSPIEEVGYITYSWVGGTGVISWSSIDGKYVGTFIVQDASVGNHQILIQASSANFKSVSIQVTIEVTEIQTTLVPVTSIVVTVNYRDIANITVYLENTDLSTPVTGASLTYGVSNFTGDLIELPTPGYYSALVDTSLLSVQEWTLSISSTKPGYTPSLIQYTLNVEQIVTEILVPDDETTITAYYGEIVTFHFTYSDTHASEGVAGAITNFTLENIRGSLVDLGNGTYTLTLNTSLVSAGSIPHDISVSFRKENYEFAFGLVKLLVKPISTEVIGPIEAVFPIGDNYSLIFTYQDTLNDEYIIDGFASAIWEFAPVVLTNLGNGSYRFGPAESGLASGLPDRTTPYKITISISRGNYSRAELVLYLTIRQIDTRVFYNEDIGIVYVGELFYVNVTFIDIDHNLPIQNADINFIRIGSRVDDGLIRVEDQDIDWGNGTYSLAFRAPSLAFYALRIEFSKLNYQVALVEIDVYTDLSPEQEALVVGFQYGTMAFLLLAALTALYIKVLSVPRLLRILRSMIGALSKGRIPKPADVPERRMMLVQMMNEDLAPVHITKTEDDVSLSTVDITAMDVEELLEQLAYVVGLTPTDVDVLRRDLDQMRPSERAGFINEVLKQERARRAKELAEADVTAKVGLGVEAEEKLSEEELAHLKERLMKMGIEETEADLMVEQARNLTRAEIDALLSEIGGMEE
ncbi:hypothetical protein EU527_02725 [Candidatus Thorarchaeota archaeon]|nr:MAG: hypothetical protein EU527_02725 [Candidatus Thorarchaeota archaeon]